MVDFLAAVAGAGSGYGYSRVIPTPLTGRSNSGKDISMEDAFDQSAFWRAVAIRVGQFAMLPLQLKKRDGKGKTRLAVEDPLYKLVCKRPNRWQNHFVWKKHSYLHTLVNGNMFNFLEMTQDGNVTAIIPLTSARVKVRQDTNGDVFYEYTNPLTNYQENIPKKYIMHWIGEHTVDGIVGLSLMQAMANCLSATQSQQEHAEAVLKNRATPSGVVTMKETLSDAAYERLKKDIRELYQGAANAGSVPIFDNGAIWTQTSLSNQDLQLAEMMKAGISEICRFVGVPEHMVGQNEHATYDNVTQFKQEFLDFTLGHDLTNIRANLDDTLLFKKNGFFFEFDTRGYLKLDPDKQAIAHAQGIQWGYLCPDDVREEIGLDPRPDGLGDVFLRPVNMVPADTPVADPNAKPADNNQQKDQPAGDNVVAIDAKKKAKEENKKRVKRASTRLTEDISKRILTKVGNKWEILSKKVPDLEQRSRDLAKNLLDQNSVFMEMIESSAYTLAETQGEISPGLEVEIRSLLDSTVTKLIHKAIEDPSPSNPEQWAGSELLQDMFETIARKVGDVNGLD